MTDSDRARARPRRTGEAPRDGSSRSSLALDNLRGVVILIVLAFHSMLAYLGSLRAAPFGFDDSPFEWRAFPIVDAHRWFGFDLFCAWQDVYLMALMFFLSALFTWPSLGRKRWRRFLADRFLRLGVPFLLALAVVMPLALYPVYRVSATDPSVAAYLDHYLALPFWPNGPMWFLWQLFAFTLLAAALHRLAPGWIERLGRWAARMAARPSRFFLALAAAAAIGYVPLALAFTPWTWNESGAFALQYSRPLLYAVFYVAGLAVGAHGLDRGLLAPEGTLARRWAGWLAMSLGSLMVWMALTALAMRDAGGAPLPLRILVDLSFVAACASGCAFVIAAALRFGARYSALLSSLARRAFGMYLVHYVFVVWLQYALLGAAMFAIGKAALVFGGTTLLAWAAASALSASPRTGVARRGLGGSRFEPSGFASRGPV